MLETLNRCRNIFFSDARERRPHNKRSVRLPMTLPLNARENLSNFPNFLVSRIAADTARDVRDGNVQRAKERNFPRSLANPISDPIFRSGNTRRASLSMRSVMQPPLSSFFHRENQRGCDGEEYSGE